MHAMLPACAVAFRDCAESRTDPSNRKTCMSNRNLQKDRTIQLFPAGVPENAVKA